MNNPEEVKGPEMKARNWLLVIAVDVLILVELAAAMYVASVYPDEFELMFMKSFFGMLVPTLTLSFLAKRMLGRRRGFCHKCPNAVVGFSTKS